MEIRGRKVEAVRYKHPVSIILTVYVKQKPGDCKRQNEPSYECVGNCTGNYLLVRYINKQPISIVHLVKQEIKTISCIEDLRGVNSLEGLEALTKKRGYELVSDRKGKILLFRGNQVAVYNPCGLAPERFCLPNKEARKTVEELTNKIDEVNAIATEKPFEALVMEPQVGRSLQDPRLELLMGMAYGQEGIDAVKEMRNIKARTN